MDSIKFSRNFLWLLFIVIVAVIPPILSDAISTQILSQPGYISSIAHTVIAHTVSFFFKYLYINGAILLIFSLLFLWINKKDRFREQIGFYSPTEYLKPERFGIENYIPAPDYINRRSDEDIEQFVMKGEYVLILGQAKIGKTSAAFKIIRKLKNFIVIKPEIKSFKVEDVSYPFNSKKNLILFLDEIEKYNGKLIKDLEKYLKSKSKKLIVIATCCSGTENEDFEKQSVFMGFEFKEVRLDYITPKDGMKLASAIGKDWVKVRFDRTPGCIVLENPEVVLKAIKIKYREANTGKFILRAIKLLKESGLNFRETDSYETELVKKICEDTFQLPVEEHAWLVMTKYLMNNSLIKSADDYIEASSAYLDYCVDKEDFCPTDKHFDSLRKIVFDRGKASEIVRLGYGYIHRKDFGNSEKCFKFVLDINPKHAHAFNGLGSVFIELGKRKENENRKEESKADFIKAVRYFEDSRNIKSLAITHRNLGYAYSLLKDYKSAEQEYRKSLQLEEGSVVTHNLLGYLLIEKFDPDGAEIELKRAIEIDPYYVPARHNLGILFSKSGNYKGAIEEFDKALKINDSHVGVYISRGIALLRQEKFDEAKSSFIKAIEINFDSGVAHYHLGLLLSHSGEKTEAMEEYRIAVKKAPNYFEAWVALGYLLVGFKKYDEGEKALKEAIGIDPHNSSAHYNLGFCLKLDGKIGDAKREFRKAIALDESLPQAHKQLASLLAGEDNKEAKEEAEKEFRCVVKLSPNNPVAHADLGYFLANSTENYDDTEDEYKKALALDPDYFEVLNNYGCFLRSRGKLEKAEEMHRKAIKIDNHSALLHNNLAIVLKERGKETDAISEFEEALRINPEYMEVYPSLGNVFERLGKDKEATKIYHKAYELKPDYEDIAIKYVIAAEKTETADEMLQIYDKLFKTHPDDINLVKTFKEYLYRFRNKINALEIIDKMIRINPKSLIKDSPVILAFKGEILRKAGEFKAAEECTKKALDLDPENFFANKNYAILKERAGDSEQDKQTRLKLYNIAEEFHKKVLLLDPKHLSTHRHLGNLLAKLEGRDHEAENEYKAIKTEWLYPENHRDYGIFLLDRGRIDEGGKELKTAIDLFRGENNDIEVQKCKDILKEYDINFLFQ